MAAGGCSTVRDVFCFPIVPGSAPMPPYRCGWDAELAVPRIQGQSLRTGEAGSAAVPTDHLPRVRWLRSSAARRWWVSMTSILNGALISPGIWSSERSTAGDARGLSDRHERDRRTAAPRTGAAGGACFEQRPAGQLYLSMLTLGEIRRGVEKLQQGERQRTLRIWLERELPTFLCRPCAADRWGCGPSLGTTDGEAGKASASNRQLAGGHCTGAQPGADCPQSQGCGGLACCRGQSLGSGWIRALMLRCVSGQSRPGAAPWGSPDGGKYWPIWQ